MFGDVPLFWSLIDNNNDKLKHPIQIQQIVATDTWFI